MKIHAFKAIYPNLELITSPDQFFGQVKSTFSRLYKDDYFFECEEEHSFVYHIITDQRSFTGLLTCLDIRDYLNGKILGHELTLSSKEDLKRGLLRQSRVITKPVLLTHKPIKALMQLYDCVITQEEPFLEVHFHKENQRHVIYKLPKGKIRNEITDIFDNAVSKAIIADGHHRCAITTSIYLKAVSDGRQTDVNKVPCVYFDFDQVEIHEYNRIIQIPDEISVSLFLESIADRCIVTTLRKSEKPKKKHELTMYLLGSWYHLKWRDEILKKYPVGKLAFDIEILNKEILQGSLGIKNLRADTRIEYVKGMADIEKIIDNTGESDSRVGFYIYPFFITDLADIVRAGKTLPPKSSWFEPRIKNGLISKSFYISDYSLGK